MTTSEARQVSRVLVIDPLERLLLLHFRLRDGYEGWIPPGGGIEPGESDEAAAVRELLEETGIAISELGPPVWVHATRYFERDVAERYFFVRVPKTPAVALEPDPEGTRPADLLEYRWWTLHEMFRAERGSFVPSRIAEYLEPLLAGVTPSTPIEIKD